MITGKMLHNKEKIDYEHVRVWTPNSLLKNLSVFDEIIRNMLEMTSVQACDQLNFTGINC